MTEAPSQFCELLRIFIPGTPKAQPRPRAFARKFGQVYSARVYDPGTAEGWKGTLAAALLKGKPSTPIDQPISVGLTFYLPRPKKFCRKKDNPGALWCSGKPDRDNLDKAVLDCMKQIGWFRDDSIVCGGEVVKLYHSITGVPGVFIVIRALPQFPEMPGFYEVKT